MIFSLANNIGSEVTLNLDNPEELIDFFMILIGIEIFK